MVLFVSHVHFLAADRSNKGALVTIPFNKWARYTNVIVAHAEKQYHRDAMLAAKAFSETMENPTANHPVSY